MVLHKHGERLYSGLKEVATNIIATIITTITIITSTSTSIITIGTAIAIIPPYPSPSRWSPTTWRAR